VADDEKHLKDADNAVGTVKKCIAAMRSR
jgi:hypothetical protein